MLLLSQLHYLNSRWHRFSVWNILLSAIFLYDSQSLLLANQHNHQQLCSSLEQSPWLLQTIEERKWVCRNFVQWNSRYTHLLEWTILFCEFTLFIISFFSLLQIRRNCRFFLFKLDVIHIERNPSYINSTDLCYTSSDYDNFETLLILRVIIPNLNYTLT